MTTAIWRPALGRHMRSIREKNADEFFAAARFRMPDFAAPLRIGRRGSEMPVFVFHAVDPVSFESQLQYLRDNEYVTLNSSQACDSIRSGKIRPKSVVLTFDDATSTFWTYAFPLLRKYEMTAVLFVIPGIVPDENSVRPSLDDVWTDRVSFSDVEVATRENPLCTWAELQKVWSSGNVDIQSHSLTHSRIPVSPKVIDIQTPDYPVGSYANSDLPVSSLDDPARPERSLRLGAPVFQYASRLSDRRRFIHDEERAREMISFVEENGAQRFFQDKNWPAKWCRRFGRDEARYGNFESVAEQQEAIERELVQSRSILESRLPDIRVRHFCLPWYTCGSITERIAKESGYEALYFGASHRCAGGPEMIHVRRVSEHYCQCLRGSGRRSWLDVWNRRVGNFRRTG